MNSGIPVASVSSPTRAFAQGPIGTNATPLLSPLAVLTFSRTSPASVSRSATSPSSRPRSSASPESSSTNAAASK